MSSTLFEISQLHRLGRFDDDNVNIKPGLFVNSFTRSSETSVPSSSPHGVTFQKTGNLHLSIPHPPGSFPTDVKWLLNVPRVTTSLCAAICGGDTRHTIKRQNRWRYCTSVCTFKNLFTEVYLFNLRQNNRR